MKKLILIFFVFISGLFFSQAANKKVVQDLTDLMAQNAKTLADLFTLPVGYKVLRFEMTVHVKDKLLIESAKWDTLSSRALTLIRDADLNSKIHFDLMLFVKGSSKKYADTYSFKRIK